MLSFLSYDTSSDSVASLVGFSSIPSIYRRAVFFVDQTVSYIYIFELGQPRPRRNRRLATPLPILHN